MPRKPPAEPIDHHYDIPRLNRAFTWTAVALTAVFVWMVIQDYSRDWKTIQRTFMRLEAHGGMSEPSRSQRNRTSTGIPLGAA